jgi:hypothetical protein
MADTKVPVITANGGELISKLITEPETEAGELQVLFKEEGQSLHAASPSGGV